MKILRCEICCAGEPGNPDASCILIVDEGSFREDSCPNPRYCPYNREEEASWNEVDP